MQAVDVDVGGAGFVERFDHVFRAQDRDAGERFTRRHRFGAGADVGIVAHGA